MQQGFTAVGLVHCRSPSHALPQVSLRSTNGYPS